MYVHSWCETSCGVIRISDGGISVVECFFFWFNIIFVWLATKRLSVSALRTLSFTRGSVSLYMDTTTRYVATKGSSTIILASAIAT